MDGGIDIGLEDGMGIYVNDETTRGVRRLIFGWRL